MFMLKLLMLWMTRVYRLVIMFRVQFPVSDHIIVRRYVHLYCFHITLEFAAL
jgi:hypothetical protein